MFCVHGAITDTAGDRRQPAASVVERAGPRWSALQVSDRHGVGTVYGAAQGGAAPATDDRISENLHSVAAHGVETARGAAQGGVAPGTDDRISENLYSVPALPATLPTPAINVSPMFMPAPTQHQIDSAPVGTTSHRIWRCPRLEVSRRRYAPGCMVSSAEVVDSAGDIAFERALFPSLAAEVPPPAVGDSFTWVVYPEGGWICGKVYSDGSRVDGPSKLLARNGWAFVALDVDGQVTAAANGVTPNWVDDIPGAEAWAVLQAASRAEPGTQYRVDCKPCVDAFHKGLAWATKDSRPHARVHRLMIAALDDTEAEAMVWMPAHTKVTDVGRLYLGDGSTLTDLDRKGNGEADRLAKLAVKAHRVPKVVRDSIKQRNELVDGTARWVARVTYAAGHQTVEPYRETEASKAAALAAAWLKVRSTGAKRNGCVEEAPTRCARTTGNPKTCPTRIPRWPPRAVAHRWRCRVKKKLKRPSVDVRIFLTPNLRPQVHAMTAAERRTALLQRGRLKEASQRAATVPDPA